MNFLKSISLKNKNWFKTGGKAKFFSSPKNKNEFKQSLNFAQKQNLKIFILGEGANVLISDEGFDGLVINPKLEKTEIKNSLITADAGVKIQDLIDFALKNNLVGPEEFSGIPGTIGGSVFINIHYIESFLSQFLVSAQIINKETTQIETVDKDWFEFGYDYSKLHEHKYFLINATFKLKKTTALKAAYAKGKSDEIIRQRKRLYPTSKTCGSFFRNFTADEIPFKINNKKITSVAYYLDKLGIKGELKVGDAAVSHKHVNMLVSTDNATSDDIAKLAKKIQQMVLDKFGILQKPECILVGFKKYPLLEER